jgi:hypothetical protein
MTARCEDDLSDDEFYGNTQALEVSIVQYVRKMGQRLHLSETTQNACMKKAMMTVLCDMVEHEPCDLARGEIIVELEKEWKRRTGAMVLRNAAKLTTH